MREILTALALIGTNDGRGGLSWPPLPWNLYESPEIGLRSCKYLCTRVNLQVLPTSKRSLL